eukprot:3531128-Prymnesium_polylepis.1
MGVTDCSPSTARSCSAASPGRHQGDVPQVCVADRRVGVGLGGTCRAKLADADRPTDAEEGGRGRGLGAR